MNIIHKYTFLAYAFVIILYSALPAQSVPPVKSDIYVDKSGIMRWKTDNSEVSLFGVNYTAPFAYSYRAMKKLNLSVKQAIDIDVSQMKRLGFNAFRLHVWDREISDENGNLLSNEHLDLLDYLLNRLAENNIKTILTPIAWWGNGYPEPDEVTKGFSDRYSKPELVTNPNAIEAQKNYLKAFLQHKNKYSGTAYKDDASIIAIEIINEPKHPSDPGIVTKYINELSASIRSIGYSRPVFYNISENWNDTQARAVAAANIDGVSFQWYPTALVHNKVLNGNFLMNVDSYSIPSDSIPGFISKAKMVYEFDAADIGASYMYPAMVRSFRKAGMQFVAMFCYDPTLIAWSNTEYPTHFMNLLYTPSKAISLMIASRAFVNLPAYKDFGKYPLNTEFGNFRISYEENLSEMNSPEEFYYSNNTNSQPVAVDKLGHIAGCGSSPIINYNGTGAYFLDKISEGLWLLEVNPDVIWITDPFGANSLNRKTARLIHNESTIKINLPSLNEELNICSMDSGNFSINKKALKNGFGILPGKYLLSNSQLTNKEISEYREKYKTGFVINSPGDENEITVINHTKPDVTDGRNVKFSFTIASLKEISKATLHIKRRGWRGFENHPLTKAGKYEFQADLNSPALHNGIVEYCITIDPDSANIKFPGNEKVSSGNWDVNDRNIWAMNIHDMQDKISLFNPGNDYNSILFPQWNPVMKYFADCKINNSGNNVFTCDIQITGSQTRPFGFMLNVPDYKLSDVNSLIARRTLVIKGRSADSTSVNLTASLYCSDGSSFGKQIELTKNSDEIEIPLSELKTTERMVLPDSYPLFLNETQGYFKGSEVSVFDIRKLDFISIVIPSDQLNEHRKKGSLKFEITEVYLK